MYNTFLEFVNDKRKEGNDANQSKIGIGFYIKKKLLACVGRKVFRWILNTQEERGKLNFNFFFNI